MTRANALPSAWRRSSHSTNGGNCVEVGTGLVGVIPVRDGKRREDPALTVSAAAWSAFVTAIRSGGLCAA
ncbi:DUF397 domain-containing protein [Streptomyces eurocidicus]|uniref:DUF397 domain-containing protein n=1 Tax=Streptomyces eurocidicus TaxID=66423 RepID=A0A7W8BAG8_STREU|nr:DUF397 domain-containing protein [Streptomyces eurocidicus]MBB5118661.1 hypothetical protein [Streptomyces eurocidicus]MBF6056265.1 DUF397 domain-containing protein [Streptomyces eurocidicus]